MSIRSTSSAAMRACSAGKSSSQSGSSCGQRVTGVGLGDLAVLRACRFPCARHDLGLAEHGAELVDDGGFDFARWNPADRA